MKDRVPHKRRGEGRLCTSATAAALTVLLSLTVPASSWAYWRAESSVTAPLAAAELTAPTGFDCIPLATGGGALGLAPSVRLSWDEAPPATQYEVWLRTSQGSNPTNTLVATTADTSQTITDTLLPGLLKQLLTLFGADFRVYATIVAVRGSWRADATEETAIRSSGLLGGLTCQG